MCCEHCGPEYSSDVCLMCKAENLVVFWSVGRMSQQLQSGAAVWKDSWGIADFSLRWNPEKLFLIPVKENLSNRVDEIARESEDKQAKSKSFLPLCPFLWASQPSFMELKSSEDKD